MAVHVRHLEIYWRLPTVMQIAKTFTSARSAFSRNWGMLHNGVNKCPVVRKLMRYAIQPRGPDNGRPETSQKVHAVRQFRKFPRWIEIAILLALALMLAWTYWQYKGAKADNYNGQPPATVHR